MRPLVDWSYPNAPDLSNIADDGLVEDKYRVYKIVRQDNESEVQSEVEVFTFVLKPNNDHHARVAIAAYAASCAIDKPLLSKDLYDLIGGDEWGSD